MKFINFIRQLANKIFSKINNKVRRPLTMNLTSTTIDTNLRCIEFTLENNNLLEGTDVIEGIYNSVFHLPKFKEFGHTKILIVSGYDYDNNFNVHPNVFVTNKTTFKQYYNKVNELIQNRYDESGYLNDVTNYFIVRVWSMDHLANTNIKIKTRSSFKPLGQKRMYSTSNCSSNMNTGTNNINEAPKTEYQLYKEWLETLSEINSSAKDFITHYKQSGDYTSNSKFSTLDLETVKLTLHKDIQIPVCITHTSSNVARECNYYQINTTNLNSTDLNVINSDVTEMFSQLMNKITRRRDSRLNNNVIFVHNLGGFDGIFIHKALVTLYGDKTTCLLDDSNKYISITYNGEIIDTQDPNNFDKIKHWTKEEYKNNEYKIEFKDSCRLFPVSLDQLCTVFGVDGKTSKYNPLFNSIDLFNQPVLLESFIKYAKQDTIGLYNALTEARKIYLTDWDVDIMYCYSAANLSMRIFRHKFMRHMKDYISVLSNSQDKMIRKSYFGGATDYYKAYGEKLHYYDVNSLYPFAMKNLMPYRFIKMIDSDKVDLLNFYGFAEVQAAIKYGYTIIPLKNGKIYEFEGKHIFNDYIDAFYAIKANSKGAQRWIAKMHLNSLYGVFGRSTELNMTALIKSEDLGFEKLTKLINRETEITEEYTLIRYLSNVDFSIIKQLQVEFTDLEENESKVMNNVAIASAVTAYARVHMMQFKVGEIGESLCYTDTDSIFTTSTLPDHMIGTELGLMKDELDGQVVDKAYFLGIKRYILSIGGKTKSVFAGIPKNSLSWHDFEELASGKTLKRELPDTFFKSMNAMTITIKPRTSTLSIKNDKKLVGLTYIPIPIKNKKNINIKTTFLAKLRKLLTKSPLNF